jgi:hypothetical protein
MDGEKPIGQDAGTSSTVMSIEGLLPDAYSTRAFSSASGYWSSGHSEGAAGKYDNDGPMRDDDERNQRIRIDARVSQAFETRNELPSSKQDKTHFVDLARLLNASQYFPPSR